MTLKPGVKYNLKFSFVQETHLVLLKTRNCDSFDHLVYKHFTLVEQELNFLRIQNCTSNQEVNMYNEVSKTIKAVSFMRRT